MIALAAYHSSMMAARWSFISISSEVEARDDSRTQDDGR